MLTQQQLREILVAAELGRIADPLSRLAKPCVQIRTRPFSYAKLPLGCSRIGGCPELPAGIDWPFWQGKALSFLAQLNLQDIGETACSELLPVEGFLWFFYTRDQSTW